MSKFQLDFNIYSSKDRLNSIKSINLSTLTKTELETISNYILYGKDEDGTSIVDRKEIQIKSKFNSYNKERNNVSLDELIESPTFDENILLKQKNIYKKAKPSIDKEKAKLIPGMAALWDEIDRLDRILRENKGDIEKQPTTPTLTQKQLYYLNHQLIELRTQQYYLWDSYYPATQLQRNKAEFHGNIVDEQLNYPIFPRGLMSSQNDIEFKFPKQAQTSAQASANSPTYTHSYTAPPPAQQLDVDELVKQNKPFIDFRNPDHIYELIQHYKEIEDGIRHIPDSPLHNLLWTLDFYIEKANFNEQQMLILEDKKYKMPNKAIADHLMRELGIYHQENYVSTIWNKLVGLIAEAVELNYDEFLCRNYEKAWKKCTRCGKFLLRDSRNFVKKSKALDGLTSRCKECDREVRKINKEKKQEAAHGI